MSVAESTAASTTIRCSVRGTITRCGRPAPGHRVICWHQLQIGISENGGPCPVGFPTVKKVGEAVVDADGEYSLAFDALVELADTCFFTSQVRVEVFDGATRVWASGLRKVVPIVRFDRELLAGCTPDSTAVRTVDEEGATVMGAQVFVNGRLRGRTDATGNLFVSPQLEVGDRLVARLLVHEHATPRDQHDGGSDRSWSHRMYITSVGVGHDAAGDDVRLPVHVVEDPGDVQQLRLRRRNVLVGLHLRASIEWDAGSTEFERYRDRIADMSELLFNATDGQFVLERVAIADDGLFWDEADIRIFANLNQPSNASLDGIFGDTGYIRMNPNDSHYAGTLLHELGHYGFGLRDEYKGTDEWDPGNGPPRCTLRSTDPDGPFADGGVKDSCLMRGNRRRDRKKFCSGHPLNPHVDGTGQGSQDCWTDILERYGDPSRWRLQTPVSRGAIPGRLPDSGVPLRGSSEPPADVDRTDSFIPVADWKPTLNELRVNRGALRPNLVVRAEFAGQPVANARVTLRTTRGRILYQGVTKSAYNLAYGVSTGPGEIPVRGAHVGDEIDVLLIAGPDSKRGRLQVTAGAETLVVALAPFDPIPQARSVVAATSAPLESATRSVWPDEDATADSADGRVRVVLPAGALSAPDLLHLDASAGPARMRGELVSGPYTLRTASGASLRAPAQLDFRVPSAEMPDHDGLVVVGLDGREPYELPTVVVRNALVAGAQIDRLGTYALVSR
jgi:hypothetical protein